MHCLEKDQLVVEGQLNEGGRIAILPPSLPQALRREFSTVETMCKICTFRAGNATGIWATIVILGGARFQRN